MRVLVTGGAGFIGGHVVDAYVREGFDVAVVDDLSTGHRRNLNPAARFYQIENKMDALLLYEMAAEIPVIEEVAAPAH